MQSNKDAVTTTANRQTLTVCAHLLTDIYTKEDQNANHKQMLRKDEHHMHNQHSNAHKLQSTSN